MSDIDFETDLRGGFQISLSDNPRSVRGNRALLNRFEITFLTERRKFFLGDVPVVDSYGGDASSIIGIPRVLNDTQSISAAISVAIDHTISSMKNDEPDNIPDTEKLDSAEISEISIVDDMVTANIRVYPVQTENLDPLEFNLPITRRG